MLVWGDDQYENFKEDIVPPFCILGYDPEFDLQPWHNGTMAASPTAGASPAIGDCI